MTSSLPPEILERRGRAKEWFETLQQRICAELERLEDEAPPELFPEPAGRFEFKPWTRETGVGGGIGAFFKGRLFEKAAVHTSAALAKFSPEMAASMPGAPQQRTWKNCASRSATSLLCRANRLGAKGIAAMASGANISASHTPCHTAGPMRSGWSSP